MMDNSSSPASLRQRTAFWGGVLGTRRKQDSFDFA